MGQPQDRAGLIVGADRSGGAVLATFSPHSFTNFRPLSSLVGAQRPVSDNLSIQPDATGQTGHVQLMGYAAPSVTSISLDLANGKSVPAQIVRLAQDGYGFFTYLSDDPATFPTSIHATAGDGSQLGTVDLSDAIKAPVTQ
jgi:hypothetical protein